MLAVRVACRAEYARFLNIAQASAAETEYLLILSRDLGSRLWTLNSRQRGSAACPLVAAEPR
jgi:four helix bundle protein